MNYLLFICSERGGPEPEHAAVMQRETPRWVEEMDGRGVRLVGRRLASPETAATVRVRDRETLVTDGPFVETKEFIAGFDLVACADLDEAVEVATKHPTSWFHAVEIRPLLDEMRLGEKASAFGREEDGEARPYMLMMWMGGIPAAAFDPRVVMDEGEAWRQDLEARGLQVLGGALRGPDTATTVQVRDGQTLLSDGPFIETNEFIAGIDVVSAVDRSQAIELAATHPVARTHAIEVRPFFGE